MSQGKIDWLVNECWLSNDFTREEPGKNKLVADPSSRAKDRECHQLRWLEVPLGEFYQKVKELGRERWGEGFHMSSTFIREHRPFWVKDTTRDVCLCRYHLEFDLLAKAL